MALLRAEPADAVISSLPYYCNIGVAEAASLMKTMIENEAQTVLIAAVFALAGAMYDEIGATPSSRCSHTRWPPSSTIEITTAQLLATASASAAACERPSAT